MSLQLDFDTTTQKLSFKNARACVIGCKDAYRNPPDIKDDSQDVQVRVARGMCALRNAWVAFFFRGTFNLDGWYRDFDPTVIQFGEGWAHKKTTESVRAVLPKIRMAIEDKRDAVFIGGHSKGAREAQNCAKQLWDLGYNVKQVYTFGTPRGFDFHAARQYDKDLGDRTWRFVHGSDIVCRVPYPPVWFHTKQEIYMPEGNLFGAFNSADWKENASLIYKLACDGKELFKDWRRKLPVFADHAIDKYVEIVSALQ